MSRSRSYASSMPPPELCHYSLRHQTFEAPRSSFLGPSQDRTVEPFIAPPTRSSKREVEEVCYRYGKLTGVIDEMSYSKGRESSFDLTHLKLVVFPFAHTGQTKEEIQDHVKGKSFEKEKKRESKEQSTSERRLKLGSTIRGGSSQIFFVSVLWLIEWNGYNDP
ncbi:hypothetical protein L1987_40246 [Smallanthus sonchifolius]|uniref:Uncharacterized protein n=1 Tax=Smallanthus sonchifolius TaxID=185202 RepID=A0ACB9GTL3_9ASTR|nr:hypothetical protein L1987_40246 [Smallanthus sonchifolius]